MTDERSAAGGGGRGTQVRERILIGLEIVVENYTEEYFSVVLVVGAKIPSDGDISPIFSLHRLM